MHKAAFLGPKAENAPELERLLLEVLHDHAFWRRNFHPGDARLIEEADKQRELHQHATARLRDELFQILAELKRGAPLYAPRQIGHMVSDPTLPAIVGYFAGLLYNQNNVVAEAAPETVRKEGAYVAALARMIGYPDLLPERLPAAARRDRTPFAWGHLCGGGTAANLEALWVARNVRLYPLAVRLLAATDPRFAGFARLEVATAAGAAGRLGDLSTAEVLNLPAPAATDLHLRIRAGLKAEGPAAAVDFEAALPSVRKAGLVGLLGAYNDRFPSDPARPPVVLASQAAHYGWAKGMDVVGLGANALRLLPVDARARLDVEALAEAARACARRGEPVLMAVSIAGTTEEGAADPVHRVDALREALAPEGLTFWHHVDAAFGGYLAAALPRDAAGLPRPYDPADAAAAELAGPGGLLEPEVYRALAAMGLADSVTLDPHKLGYVPYPAGAVLFRDYHVRDAVAFAAPYLPTDEAAGFGGFLGQWTLEGSRPGAAAVSAYLSQTVVPLTPDGHGALVRSCLTAARSLVAALEARFAGGPVALKLLAEPDTVGCCFALVPREGAGSLEAQNRLTRRIWRRVSVDGRDDAGSYAFILSKTEVAVARYRPHLTAMLGDAVLDGEDGASVLLLRSFVTNPFLADWDARDPGFAALVADYLHEAAMDAFAEHALAARTAAGRVRVRVVEEAPEAEHALTRRLQDRFAAYLDVRGSRYADAPLPGGDVVVVDAPPEMEAPALLALTALLIEGPPPGGILVRSADGVAPMLAVPVLPRGEGEADLRDLALRLCAPPPVAAGGDGVRMAAWLDGSGPA